MTERASDYIERRAIEIANEKKLEFYEQHAAATCPCKDPESSMPHCVFTERPLKDYYVLALAEYIQSIITPEDNAS